LRLLEIRNRLPDRMRSDRSAFFVADTQVSQV
jgi:hypothetical protein